MIPKIFHHYIFFGQRHSSMNLIWIRRMCTRVEQISTQSKYSFLVISSQTDRIEIQSLVYSQL